jgi:hypothetical protein
MSHTQSLLVGAFALAVLGVPADGRAQGPTASRPVAMIVLDDTTLVDGPRARLAAAGVEALERAFAETQAAVAAFSSGPGGLSIDLSDDRSVLRSVAQSIREGRYDFRGPADDAKAAEALDATIEDGLNGLARQKAAAVLVVIGRSTAGSPERMAKLEATSAAARRHRTQVVWLDFEPGGCDRAPMRDSTALTEPNACSVLTDPASIGRVTQVARTALFR